MLTNNPFRYNRLPIFFLGVRIIPEFDAPAHVGYGWQYPGAENFTVCLDKQPWLVNNITMGSKTL